MGKKIACIVIRFSITTVVTTVSRYYYRMRTVVTTVVTTVATENCMTTRAIFSPIYGCPMSDTILKKSSFKDDDDNDDNNDNNDAKVRTALPSLLHTIRHCSQTVIKLLFREKN